MPRQPILKAVKESPEFVALYSKWKQLKKFPLHTDFEDFNKFFKWSMKHGYQQGAQLILINEAKPYGPKNCEWRKVQQKTQLPLRGEEQQEFVKKWNKAVNRIRKHYGMKPLEE